MKSSQTVGKAFVTKKGCNGNYVRREVNQLAQLSLASPPFYVPPPRPWLRTGKTFCENAQCFS